MTVNERIADLFDAIETEFPDKSTEFLLELTAHNARRRGIKKKCDSGDVADALFQRHEKRKDTK